MRIREADPPGDALLLKGSEGQGEAVAALPFPGAGRGNVPSPFAPVQRPVPAARSRGGRSCTGDPWPCGSPTEKNMPCLGAFRDWLSGREK